MEGDSSSILHQTCKDVGSCKTSSLCWKVIPWHTSASGHGRTELHRLK
ncbi:hypothetical protein Nmel_012243 [Mimus melanotis]